MKKLLLLTIALTMLASCQKGDEPKPDESTLVSGIVMPAGEFMTNDQVTITGAGFLDGDAIVLRAAAKSSDIDAVVTEVTESQLVFMMPAGVAAGKMNVVLKRDVKKQTLGEVTIASIPPAKIYGLLENYSDYEQTDLYEIDPATGVATYLSTFDDRYRLREPVVIGHTIYTNDWSSRHIVSYNLDTKEFKKISDKISNQRADDALGRIDGKLHVLAVVDDIVKLISIDDATGAKTEVASFGKLQNAICATSWFTIAGGFAYDAKNKKIIIAGFWDGLQSDHYTEHYYQTVVLDLSNNTIEHLDITHYPTYYLMRGTQLCRITEARTGSSSGGRIEKLNDKYQVEAQLASISNARCFPAYDAAEDIVYLYANNGWCSIDLKTTPATFKTVKSDQQQLYKLFIVR